MNENLAMSLILLCVLAGWLWIWSATTTHLVARGLNYLLAHLAGALFGSGAAFGAFCLSGALLMPEPDNRISIAVGAFGVLILSLYFALFYPSLRTPRKTLRDFIHTWKKNQKNKQGEPPLQGEQKRIAQEKALGMPFDTFFSKRLGDHLMSWSTVLFLVVCGGVIVSMPSGNWLIWFFASATVTVVLAVVFGSSYISFLLFLLLLPFACISIFVEARWRIRHNQPYVAPPAAMDTDEPDQVVDGDEPSPPSNPTPSQCTGGWLVPLVIGLWIGSWGKDD